MTKLKDFGITILGLTLTRYRTLMIVFVNLFFGSSGIALGKPLVELVDGKLLWPHQVVLPNGGGTRVVLYSRALALSKWVEHAEITRTTSYADDIGDGTLIAVKNKLLGCGEEKGKPVKFLYILRENLIGGPGKTLETRKKVWRITVLQSTDDFARRWTFHSTVTSHGNSEAGLWSPFLLELNDGTLQAYYDDELTPHQVFGSNSSGPGNFSGHQWATMKTFVPYNSKESDPKKHCTWKDPVSVSRTMNNEVLARDGMVSVVQIGNSDTLVATLESVDLEKIPAGVDVVSPYRGAVRIVRSEDRGKTWNFAQGREVLYSPERRSNKRRYNGSVECSYYPVNAKFNAFQPWLTKLRDQSLLVVFATDEDEECPGETSTDNFSLTAKFMRSFDGGITWSPLSLSNPMDKKVAWKRNPVSASPKNIWVPGVMQRRNGTVIINYIDRNKEAFGLTEIDVGPFIKISQ